MVTFYFEDERLKQITITPERNRYNRYIAACKTKEGDQFAVVVQPGDKIITGKRNIEGKRYALASKKFVENRLKVRYMYREKPDGAADSG